jgi:hypothetical protein
MLVVSNPAPTLLGYDDRSSLWEEKRERVFLPCLKLEAGCVLGGMSSIKSESLFAVVTNRAGWRSSCAWSTAGEALSACMKTLGVGGSLLSSRVHPNSDATLPIQPRKISRPI